MSSVMTANDDRAAHDAPTESRARLAEKRRVVVKVGSALLAKHESCVFDHLGDDIAAAFARGCQCILVSSGAIALGLGLLGLKKRPSRVDQLQAAAASGQPALMARWATAMGKHHLPVAQVLLTHADLADRERFLNARHAMAELLRHKVLPVVNENDSVATDEIRVGDNDTLAAHVATLVEADLLIILTSVDGLYDANPETHSEARRIPVVAQLDSVLNYAGGAGLSGLGTGGMQTKLAAAKVAISRSIPVVIARGDQTAPLRRILAGEDVGTLFLPSVAVASRKHWIGFTLKPRGRLLIDAGAARALLTSGKSLLPSGLVRVEGEFARGAMVEVCGPAGPLARGLVAYSAAELIRLQGHRSDDIATILGYVATPEIIHRDDLVMLTRPAETAVVAAEAAVDKVSNQC